MTVAHALCRVCRLRQVRANMVGFFFPNCRIGDMLSHDVLELVLGRTPARSMCCRRWHHLRVLAEIARLGRRVGGRAAGMATDFGSPWRARLFLDMVKLGCRHGVVAGSAALYLELEPPLGWRPSDVDCWVESREIGHQAVMGALDAGGDPEVRLYSDGKYETVNYNCEIPTLYGPHYTSGVAEPVQANYPGNSLVVEVTVRGQRFQVISQNIVNAGNLVGGPAACDCAAPPTLPACRACRACRACLGPVEAPALVAPSYTLEWPPGMPHTRFDIGLVCVDARSDGSSIKLTRRAGRSDRLDIRPQALWRVDGGKPVARPADSLLKRVAKYVARGFPVTCPRTVCYEGRNLATLTSLVEALSQIPGIKLTV